VGSKETLTVADGTATRATGTPADLRSAAVLSPAQAGELAPRSGQVTAAAGPIAAGFTRIRSELA
jgi:hypothetical protein